MSEYRIEELATATSTTVRTLQSYRSRGLLPAPRRAGRIVLFDQRHVERLSLIADLIGRGYSLNAVAELLDGLDQGHGIEQLLGLATPKPAPFTIRGSEIADRLAGPASIDDLTELGVITATGGGAPTADPIEATYQVVLPAALAAGEALVAAGVPRDVALEIGLEIRQGAARVAKRFVELAVEHLVDEQSLRTTDGMAALAETVTKLGPHAEAVTAEYVGAVLRDEIGAELQRQLEAQLAARAAIAGTTTSTEEG